MRVCVFLQISIKTVTQWHSWFIAVANILLYYDCMPSVLCILYQYFGCIIYQFIILKFTYNYQSFSNLYAQTYNTRWPQYSLMSEIAFCVIEIANKISCVQLTGIIDILYFAIIIIFFIIQHYYIMAIIQGYSLIHTAFSSPFLSLIVSLFKI